MSIAGARNGRTSNQDYTNLLFSDSDSDSRIPDLKLPPVKGKKLKKKRGGLSYNYTKQDEPGCGVWSVMKVFLFLVLLAVVGGLSIVSFWSMQKISTLQEKVDKLEQSDTTSSMTKFQNQLVSLNKSLTSIRSGTGGMKALSAAVEEVNVKFKGFEDTSKQLSDALASSKDLFDLPQKWNELAPVLADMKNDILETVNSHKELSTRLEVLEKRLEESSGDSTVSTTTKAPTSSDQDHAQSNQNITSALVEMKQRLDFQETKMSTLEDMLSKTSPSSTPFNTSVISSLVQDTLIESLKESQKDLMQKGDFLVFKEDVLHNFQSINDSLTIMNHEFDSVYNHLEVVQYRMKNLTAVLERNVLRMNATVDDVTEVSESENDASLDGEDSASHSAIPSAQPTAPATSTVAATTSTAASEQSVSKETTPSQANREEGGETEDSSNTGDDSNRTDEGGPTVDTNKDSLIKAENITTVQEFEEAFSKLSLEDDLLNLEQLELLLHDNNLTQEQVEAIDTNKDGLFSKLEIAKSLGFQDISAASES